MTKEQLRQIVEAGEGITTEFKKASFELPKNLLETVCAMLNRRGGHIVLGVTDDGVVEGVIDDAIQGMKNNFVSAVNDVRQLNPKFYLAINDFVIFSQTVLHIYVPESSQVHAFNGRIFDRNEDGDFDITNNPDLIRQLHFRKQESFS